MVRSSMIVLAVVAIAFVTSMADAQGKAKKHATPEAAFDAFKAAVEKKDFKAAAACLTDESVDGMTGGMIIAGSFIKAFAKFDKEKGEELVKQIDTIFQKHGVTEEALGKIGKGGLGKDPEAAAKAMREVAKIVKDRPAFIGDMYKFMETTGKSKDGNFDAKATLKDVMVTGDTAKGTIVNSKGEKPINFKKIDGGWKLDFPIEAGAKKAPGAVLPNSGAAAPGLSMRAALITRRIS